MQELNKPQTLGLDSELDWKSYIFKQTAIFSDLDYTDQRFEMKIMLEKVIS